MNTKPKAGDKITIQVSLGNRYNGQDSTQAEITHVAESGRIFFRPLKKLMFKDYRHNPQGTLGVLHAGIIYSTDEYSSGQFTGQFKDILFIRHEESQTTPKIRSVDVTIEPTHKILQIEDLPKHENRYTTELNTKSGDSRVVDRVGEFFKAFTSNNPHHHWLPPHKKFSSLLTGACEDAKKKAEEFKEAAFIADRVVNHGDIEYTVRMMLKAGLTPHQIAEEIQRQFYNAMVNE